MNHITKTQKWKVASDDLVQNLHEILNNNLIGVYLTGSAVLDDWYEGKSDIDFTVVIDKPIQQSDISILYNLYKNLGKKYPKTKIEVQYVPLDLLGKCEGDIKPTINYNDKKHTLSYFGYSPVTWFTLKKHGISIYGRAIPELNLNTTEEELIKYVLLNVNSYWTKWVSVSERLFSVRGVLSLVNWSVEWCVCGLSRMYYTLRNKDIISKGGAVKYMLNIAPEHYRPILQEALFIRTSSGERLYTSKFKRRKDMIDYTKYIIKRCNELYHD